MVRNLFFFLIFIFLIGCEGLKKGLGITKDRPDEFLIKKIEPIEMPPNYDLLPPDSKKQTLKKNNAKNILDSALKENNDSKNYSEKKIKSDTVDNLENDILNQIKK